MRQTMDVYESDAAKVRRRAVTNRDRTREPLTVAGMGTGSWQPESYCN